VTSDEHDTFDDWPELRQLRELHQSDRMPPNLRERVSKRAESLYSPLQHSPGRSPVGLASAASPALSSAALPSAALSSARSSVAEPAPPSRSSEGPLRWAEASRAPARGRRHALTFAAGGGLCAAAALALWVSVPPARITVESEHPAPLELVARPYGSDELRAIGVEPGVTEVRVVGTLVPGSITRLPPLPPNHRTRCGYHFHVRQPGASTGDGIHIEYARCRAPEQLNDDGARCVEVDAIGLLRADGHLDATRVTPTIDGRACSPR
jgi:hypothetical protein